MPHSSVSVVIPTYNRADLLQSALQSVLSQSIAVLEILVIDDGSEDKTISEVLQTMSLYPHMTIRLLRISHCGMPGAVRNIGIQHARGTYIAFLDSDDVWLPNKLELQVPLMKTYDICHTREIWIRDGKKISQSKQRHTRYGDMFKDSLHKCIIGPSTVMIHRRIFEKHGLFREDLRIAEDYELWLRITSQHYIGYVDMPLVIKYSRQDRFQLSREFPSIENFRIAALQPLVEKHAFESEKQHLAEIALKRKLNIWNIGAKKYAAQHNSV